MTSYTRVTDYVDDVLATHHNELVDGLQKLDAPQGWLQNGKIVVSVATNNITVAIKTLAGVDPSITNPVSLRIGDTIRQITAALSVTVNAGTNWFNSGSAELATEEVDYFVYIGWNAIDGVTIGFARIPYSRRYGQFSVTSTSEKYCAISTITNAAGTDYYEQIGRFAAMLGAGAGYAWSVPTFTALNLIQRPIYETRPLIYAPQPTGFSANPTFATAIYKLIGRNAELYIISSGGTSNATTFTLTAPFACQYALSYPWGRANDNGSTLPGGGRVLFSGATMSIRSNFSSGAWTASAGKNVDLAIMYPIA